MEVQGAIDRREVDTNALLIALAGNASCTLLTRFLSSLRYDTEIFVHLDRIFGDRVLSGNKYTFQTPAPPDSVPAQAHLDLPTSKDPTTLAKLSQISGGPRTPYNLLNTIIGFATTMLQLVTQIWMLMILLRNQPESAWLVIGSFTTPFVKYIRQNITEACRFV